MFVQYGKMVCGKRIILHNLEYYISTPEIRMNVNKFLDEDQIFTFYY